MLHITNGDCAVAALRRAGIADPVLPWRDVLHDGPVPGGLSLPELSRVRAGFIAACGWASRDEAALMFATRDAELAASTQHDRVILWFESDLYDQLQLAQILAWYRDRGQPSELKLACVDRDSRDDRFHGLGGSDPARINELGERLRVLNEADLQYGGQVWDRFRGPDPAALNALRGSGSPHLPELREALRRLLEELPWVASGLSRTEQAALRTVEQGADRPQDIFRAVQDQEARPFMGDRSFWRILNRLGTGPSALLRNPRGEWLALSPAGERQALRRLRVQLTETGRRVLAGGLDAIEALGLDRWIGGTQLVHPGKVWRWDGALGRPLSSA